MTNQQSIDRLLSLSLWLDKDSEIYQAIAMAISALEAQEAKTQLSAEGTTPKVKKTCITCKHNSTSNKKWPCVDCDMREPADRWEPQELSKNSPKLDKENGDLQPTCNELATDCISRKAVIDALNGLCDRECEYSKKQRHVMCDACHLGSAFDVLEQLPTQTNTPNTLDCVERQAAIDVLMEFDKKLRKINWYQYPYTEYECRGVDKAIVKIANLPSAQPETHEERTETHACDLIERQKAIDWRNDE